MLSNNYAPIRQLGNGVTTNFSAAWSMLSAAYAQVFLENAVTGVQTPVTQGGAANQYQITINSSGFQVTFGTAPTAAQYAVIGRSVSIDQTDPYKTSKGFQGAVEEDSFDKLTAICQDINDLISRSIVAPLGDVAALTLPTATSRANGFLAFDASGNILVTGSGGSNVPISAPMVPVVQAASVSAALALLGGIGAANAALTGTATLNAHGLITRVTRQVFLSSGTYTPTAGMVYADVECVGGGGGGGGAKCAAVSQAASGAGGGEGGLAKKVITAAAIGASQTVTIGAAGTAGTVAGGGGGTGGNTTFGAILTGLGGNGGQGVASSATQSTTPGSSGGGASGGDLNRVGNAGAGGFAVFSPFLMGFGGAGANSTYGTGGIGAVVNGGAGAAGGDAAGNGAGGGGAVAINTATGQIGGVGVKGIVVVTEYLTN